MFGKLIALLLAVVPSGIKVLLLRARGMHIGSDVRVGFGTLLLCKSMSLDDGASIGHFCIIRCSTLRMGKRSAIGNAVRIAVNQLVMKSQSAVSSHNQISGDPADTRSVMHIGIASWILQGCYINVARKIQIGRNVGVGGGSYLFTHGLWLSKLDGFPVSYGEIVIEDDVWLPWGCFILPNVTIGSKAVVGARSVVNHDVPAGA